MPVFKVVALDRKKKVLVTGSNLKDIIDKGRLKLELPDETNKVVLDEDGTVLDEDEVLMEIGKSSSTVTLMLLTDEQAWNSAAVSQQDTPDRSNAGSSISGSAPRAHSPTNANLPELDIGSSVWNRFPKRLLANCKAGTSADPTDQRLMVAVLADYVLNELKDPSRGAATRIAKHIAEKYPRTFGDMLSGQVMGAGSETLRAQLYNAVQYRRDMSKVKHRNIASDENSDEDTEAISNVCRKRDEYGCSEYQPLLPDAETPRSQENKRLKLQELFAEKNIDADELLELFDSTYSTQRACFSKSRYLIGHANRLLGKSVQDEWNTVLEKKGKSIAGYFKTTYKRRERKRKSDKTPTALDTVAINGLGLLADCKNSITAERTVIPMTCVIFPLLINHFQETAGKLYKVDTDSTALDTLAGELAPYPVLIIQGQSFYDENAKYIVAVEGCFIHAQSLSEGFLTVILTYYVFGYAYQDDVCRCLEFMQRVFLGINPTTGHKRAGKQRKNVSFDPKVSRLAREIEAFEKDLEID